VSQYIVTLKLARNVFRPHDPANKVTGPCPLSGHECTDLTGVHHSVVVDAQTAADARVHFTSQGIHVTRVEALSHVPAIPRAVVTDTMVNAALVAISDAARAELAAYFDGKRDLDARKAYFEHMRAGITAALKAGCTHPRMGDWWPCNFGADEVRSCPDCDHLEKRPATPKDPS
jgi:hypothetical protein